MKVYTKTGDSGSTALYGGKRISKAHLRIESYGNVDELNAYIGLILEEVDQSELRSFLIGIQNNLFDLGGILASGKKVPPPSVPLITEHDIRVLEIEIDRIDTQLEPLQAFVLPGGSRGNALCHVARCICRRAERSVVRLNETEELDNRIIIYLNRLSDYLFMLARLMSKMAGAEEIKWQPKKNN